MTGLAILGYVLAAFILKDLEIFGLKIMMFAVGLAVLALFVNITLYLITTYIFYFRLNLVKFTANSTVNKVYAYLDRRSRLINFTEEFANLIGIEKNIKKKYEEIILTFLVDSQEMNYDVFLHYIRTLEERDYRISITLNDGKNLLLDLMKRKVIYNGKLLGFVLMSYGTTALDGASFDSRTFYNYLNFLGEPICYFDFRTRRYILTGEMMNLLGVSDNQLGENNFLSAVVKEDLNLISSRNLTDKLHKIYYRLNTNRGRIWFEESNINYEGHYYAIIHKTDFSHSKMNFRNLPELLETTKLIYERNNWIALLLVKFSNLPKFIPDIGKDVGEVILAKYFSQVASELGLKAPKVYRLEDFVYVLIIDKKEIYNRFLESLNTGKTSFVKTGIIFNEIKYEIENALGIISSENAENPHPETILKAGQEALSLAADDKYPESYCIYIPKPTPTVDFKDMGIDLSDNFLDDILKE
jgi:hypothetical protein